MYVISPWSKGGWVNSQTFDHTSVGQFLEKRFGVTIPGISPWHRAVCGDLLSAFDFVSPNDPAPPLAGCQRIGRVGGRGAEAAQAGAAGDAAEAVSGAGQPAVAAVALCAACRGRAAKAAALTLTFRNDGTAGAVFHVYDRSHLERIPRRYTVEAGASLTDRWDGGGPYDLWVLGPNGFVREFAGKTDTPRSMLRLVYRARGARDRAAAYQSQPKNPCVCHFESPVYRPVTTRKSELAAHGTVSPRWDVSRKRQLVRSHPAGGKRISAPLCRPAGDRKKWRQRSGDGCCLRRKNKR